MIRPENQRLDVESEEIQISRLMLRFLLQKPVISWYRAADFYIKAKDLVTHGVETSLNDQENGNLNQQIENKQVPSFSSDFISEFAGFIRRINSSIGELGLSCEIRPNSLDPIRKLVCLRNILDDQIGKKFNNIPPNATVYFNQILTHIIENSNSTFEVPYTDLNRLVVDSSLKSNLMNDYLRYFIDNEYLTFSIHKDLGSQSLPLYKVTNKDYIAIKKLNEDDSNQDKLQQIELLADIFDQSFDSSTNIEQLENQIVNKSKFKQLTLDAFGFENQNRNNHRNISLITLGPRTIIEFKDWLKEQYEDLIHDCSLCHEICTFRYSRCNSCNNNFHNVCLEGFASATFRALSNNNNNNNDTDTDTELNNDWNLSSRGSLNKDTLLEFEITVNNSDCPSCSAKSLNDSNPWFNNYSKLVYDQYLKR